MTDYEAIMQTEEPLWANKQANEVQVQDPDGGARVLRPFRSMRQGDDVENYVLKGSFYQQFRAPQGPLSPLDPREIPEHFRSGARQVPATQETRKARDSATEALRYRVDETASQMGMGESEHHTLMTHATRIVQQNRFPDESKLSSSMAQALSRAVGWPPVSQMGGDNSDSEDAGSAESKGAEDETAHGTSDGEAMSHDPLEDFTASLSKQDLLDAAESMGVSVSPQDRKGEIHEQILGGASPDAIREYVRQEIW